MASDHLSSPKTMAIVLRFPYLNFLFREALGQWTASPFGEDRLKFFCLQIILLYISL